MSSPIFVKQSTVGTITFPVQNAAGDQVSFDSTPVFAIYGDHSDTPQLTGTATELTLTSDKTRPGGSVAVTGVQHIQVDFTLADTNFWVSGRHYSVWVDGGTIASGSINYAGRFVHDFQFEDIASVSDLDVWSPKVGVDLKDETADKITVRWLRNGLFDTSVTVSNVTVTAYRGNHDAGTAPAIVTDAAMTQLGTTKTFSYKLTGANRIASDEILILDLKATLNGVVRTQGWDSIQN